MHAYTAAHEHAHEHAHKPTTKCMVLLHNSEQCSLILLDYFCILSLFYIFIQKYGIHLVCQFTVTHLFMYIEK